MNRREIIMEEWKDGAMCLGMVCLALGIGAFYGVLFWGFVVVLPGELRTFMAFVR